ncbi:MAG: DUF192 domain-containing protein [Chloroflexi bacterium]|nr:DUF192 domain-containing protein [Chloroflexota bacterium]
MDKLIKVSADQVLIASNVDYADSAQLRKQGVLGRPALGTDEGVLLVMPRRSGLSLLHSIHMFGVPFALAVAWLDNYGQVLDVKLAKPGRMYFPSGFFTDTAYILEVHPDHFPLLQISTKIHWEDLND